MLAVRAGGGLLTETVCCEVTVCWGEPLSLTVRVTVKDPADEYACVTEAPVPVDPSPNDQLKL